MVSIGQVARFPREGAPVVQAQIDLRDLGLFLGGANGLPSPEFDNALRTFQEREGLPTSLTPVLDSETLSRLQLRASEARAARQAPPATPPIATPPPAPTPPPVTTAPPATPAPPPVATTPAPPTQGGMTPPMQGGMAPPPPMQGGMVPGTLSIGMPPPIGSAPAPAPMGSVVVPIAAAGIGFVIGLTWSALALQRLNRR